MQLFAKRRACEVKVCNKKVHESFERTEEWVKTQVLPSLFIFSEVVGIDKLLEMIEAQAGRLKPLQRKMLEKFKWEFDYRHKVV